MTRKEEIKESSRKYFDDYIDGLNGEILTVQKTFEDAAKWADKTMINKACEWLEDCAVVDIEEFRKAMEE